MRKFYVPDEYMTTGKPDYALLLLEHPIGEVTGYFGLSVLDSEMLMSKNITVTGYPSDKVKEKPKIYELWEVSGKPAYIKEDVMGYEIDVVPGQNGGGVWYEEEGQFFVVGVCVKVGSIVNEATLVTRKIYEQMCKWVKETIQKEIEENPGDYVRTLYFSYGGKMTNAEMNTLSRYKLNGLQYLYLGRREMGDIGAQALAENKTWVNLLELELYHNNIEHIGIEALAENNTWINIQKLILFGNNIGDVGVAALAKNISWANLEHLHLGNNLITDIGAKALTENTIWINLENLNLSQNLIGDSGAIALAGNNSWKNLKELDLSDNRVEKAGKDTLAKKKQIKIIFK